MKDGETGLFRVEERESRRNVTNSRPPAIFFKKAEPDESFGEKLAQQLLP